MENWKYYEEKLTVVEIKCLKTAPLTITPEIKLFCLS